jgi:hypothetical protein
VHVKHSAIELATDSREALYDITDEVRRAVGQSGIKNGLVSVYAQGATAGIMIQENWDESVSFLSFNCSRQKQIPIFLPGGNRLNRSAFTTQFTRSSGPW